MSVRRFTLTNAQAASQACAEHILHLVETTLAVQPRVSLAVSGGSTPKLMFRQMASMDFPWDRIHFFLVDERCVAPTDDQSNYKLLKEQLLDTVKAPAANVHRVMGELVPHVAATNYVDAIRAFFGCPSGQVPSFDIVHRGMGPDAHSASLFPGDPLIDDTANIAAATFVPKFNQWRVTLLSGVLKAAKHTLFLVAGDDKAEAVRSVNQGPYDPKHYPSQIGNDGPDVTWFLDEAAARLLK